MTALQIQSKGALRLGQKSSHLRATGFTLVELLVVMAVISILAAILLPALSKASERARAVFCLNNTKQLAVATQLYTDEHDGLLPYNLAMNGTSFRTNLNWVNNVMTWNLSPDNTNLATITDASLGVYVGATAPYRCPSDHALSSIQVAAGWTARIRSYSMNAMIGNAGNLSMSGINTNNPGYIQFLKMTQIPRPSDIFVFLDEHPDSINDGYFLEHSYESEWYDLPASYHNNAAAFSFADGHSVLHRWMQGKTVQPPKPDGAALPMTVGPAQNSDLEWVVEHMSIENNAKQKSGN